MFNKIVDIVGEAGQFLKEKFLEHHFRQYGIARGVNFWHKTPYELLADEDLLSQEIIMAGLNRLMPGVTVYSEERDNLSEIETDTKVKFLIDPLDGTHNYCYGNSAWGISLAYLDEKNDPLFGVIYIPMLDVFLLAPAGKEQTTMLRYNYKEVVAQTIDCLHIKNAIFCYDNQFYKLPPKAFEIYRELTNRCFTTRITGSAVYDSAMVASGKMSGRIWNSTNSYDIAAGIIIVRKAGGIACNFKGEDASIFDKEVIVCANEAMKTTILKIINDIQK